MTSTIKVNKIQDSCGSALVTKCGSNITLGASGKNVIIACGATTVGMGRTGTVDWCTTAKTSPFTAVSGDGYFINTTSGAVTVTLPASPSAGDIVSIADYTNTFQTNSVTVGRNSSKIGGVCSDAVLNTEGQSVTFVYVDGTEGWKNVQDSTSNVTGSPAYIEATGGTVTTCGDFKIHTFNADATFCVSQGGLPTGSNAVEYLVVAGGGASGGGDRGAGGGGGGYRFASCFSVTAQGYPITIGAGGAAVSPNNTPGLTPSTVSPANGNNSIFSSITSTGGGRGGVGGFTVPGASATSHGGGDGGSGGGGGTGCAQQGPVGSGNTPPVTPSQGNPGGLGQPGPVNNAGGGGGGAGAVGGASTSPGTGGTGGAGSNASPIDSTLRAGGGGGHPGGSAGPGGGAYPGSGTVNTGGGGGGSGGLGGSGVVLIKYKFQN
jgi:hypothetical protein